MVKKVSIGVIDIQGAVTEHMHSMKQALKEVNITGEVFAIREKEDLIKVNALIIPGGESTTISRILLKKGIYEEILKRLEKKDIAIMGTCAGCVLLSKKIIDNKKEIKILNAMDIEVKRNAFGSQRESFEQKIKIKGFSKPYNAVFIRAPIIEKIYNNCEILAKIENKIIMARQDNLLAISFHPELTDDLRVHKYFLDMVLSFHYRHQKYSKSNCCSNNSA
jgi:pyridoxal 5'-phosphate synthase pdxT subunit